MLPFFYTSGTPHARHIRASFELWSRAFCTSLLVSFFLLVFLWKEFNSHSFVVTFHFSRLFGSPPVFLSSRGWLLDSRKSWLFRLHIQHTTCCLFECRTPVGSSEAAVCRFCLSISLQPLHTNVQVLDDQQELIYNSFVQTQDVVKKICRKWWITLGSLRELFSGFVSTNTTHILQARKQMQCENNKH